MPSALRPYARHDDLAEIDLLPGLLLLRSIEALNKEVYQRLARRLRPTRFLPSFKTREAEVSDSKVRLAGFRSYFHQQVRGLNIPMN